MNEQLALFVDFENVAIWAAQESLEFDISRLVAFLQSRGTVVIKRAYADWSHFSRYREDLLGNSMDLTQVYNTNASGKKNRADMWMTVDALETAIARPNIETMVIVSGDSDFGPLVSKLREYGRYVIGIGPQNGSHHLLVKACDEFIYLDTILGNGQAVDRAPEHQAARQLLREAVEIYDQRAEIPVLATKLKQMMLSMDATFSETELGYRQFRAFLEDNGDLIKLYQKGLQVYAAPQDFTLPENWGLESQASDRGSPPQKTIAAARPEKPEPDISAATPSEDTRTGLESEMFNSSPYLLQIIKDMLAVELDEDVGRDLESAEALAKKGMAARAHDFSAAAGDYLAASRLMWEVVEQSPQDRNASSTLKWMMASYASCRAAEISQVQKKYDAARPYYLGYFLLVGMLEPEVEHTRALTSSMLKHYWWNVGRELEIQFSPAASPLDIAIQAAQHENLVCQEKWQASTAELAAVYPALLAQTVRQMRLNQEEAPEGVMVAQQIEEILTRLQSDQMVDPAPPDVPVEPQAGIDQDAAAIVEPHKAWQDSVKDPFLQILVDDIVGAVVTEVAPDRIQAAHKLIEIAAQQRSRDLMAAARNCLMACRMMADAIQDGEPDAAHDTLRWLMGEYAATKGAELSIAQFHSEARPYFLAFFAAAQIDSPAWEKLNVLVYPILTQYWLDVGNELGLAPEIVNNPVEAAVTALVHTNQAYPVRWAQLTETLIQANPELMRSFAAQEKQTGLARGRLVAIEIEKIFESQVI